MHTTRLITFGFMFAASLATTTGVLAQEQPRVQFPPIPKPVDPFVQPDDADPADPALTPDEIAGGLFAGMADRLTAMLVKVMDTYLDYMARPATADKLATFQKNYFDALVKKGFTEEQAFLLVRDFGNPLDGLSTSGSQ